MKFQIGFLNRREGKLVTEVREREAKSRAVVTAWANRLAKERNWRIWNIIIIKS